MIKPFILVALMVCLMLSAIADPYQTGHSYDNAGQRVDGLLWYTQGAFGMLFNTPGKLAFKENADSKKIWLTVDDISSFVIGKDSFAIVCNINVNSIQGHFKKDFALVEIAGAMNMFRHRRTLQNGKYYFLRESYILSKDNKNFFAVWKPKKQKQEIDEFFADDQNLEGFVPDKQDFKKIPELVEL